MEIVVTSTFFYLTCGWNQWCVLRPEKSHFNRSLGSVVSPIAFLCAEKHVHTVPHPHTWSPLQYKFPFGYLQRMTTDLRNLVPRAHVTLVVRAANRFPWSWRSVWKVGEVWTDHLKPLKIINIMGILFSRWRVSVVETAALCLLWIFLVNNEGNISVDSSWCLRQASWVFLRSLFYSYKISPCSFSFWQKKESLGEVLELLEKVRLLYKPHISVQLQVCNVLNYGVLLLAVDVIN